jgi:hypothetical protein
MPNLGIWTIAPLTTWPIYPDISSAMSPMSRLAAFGSRE